MLVGISRTRSARIFAILVATVVLFPVSMSTALAAPLPVHASSSTPRSPIPNFITDYCLEVVITSANALNTNQAQPKGEVINGCGFTVTSGRLDLFAFEECNGVSANGSDSSGIPNLSPHQVWNFTALLTGLCEVCQNHQPVAWPPFTLVSQADASGKGPGSIIVEDTGTAEHRTAMQNSSAYSFPCP